MFNYMPHFEDNLGNTWDIQTLDFVITGFGRGFFITANCKSLKQDKTFTYSYLKDEFIQWSSDEVVDCIPVESNLTTWFQKVFKLFDNGDD